MAGEYTESVRTMSQIINTTEYVTSDGEVLTLDKRVADHIAMDMENLKESKSVKVGANAENIKSKKELHTFISSNIGNFYFNFYKPLLELKLGRQYIFRFIYLCTFLNYDGFLEYGNLKEGNNKVNEKDLLEIFIFKNKDQNGEDTPIENIMSEREVYRTKKILIDNKLIIINDDKTVSVNKDFCIKGSIGNKSKGGIRIMDCIKDLYEKAKVSEHKKIGMLIDLIPHINLQYNIICDNVEVKVLDDIKPYGMLEIANILGYKNVSRLKRDLLDLTVNDLPVAVIFETKLGKSVAINPMVYYKGTRIDALKYLCGICNIKYN